MKASGTVCVFAATPAVDRLRQLGVADDRILRSAGLTPEALSSVEHRLPYENVAQLWEIAAREANDPSFGVHVAEALPVGALDLVEYLLSASATVGEGLARLARYVRLVYDHSNLHLVIEPRHARLVRRDPAPAPQFGEFSTTLIVLRSRRASGAPWRPEHVQFQHAHPGRDGELERVLACPIRFGAPQGEIRFAPSVLEIPHVHSDSRLLDILIRYADSLLHALPRSGNVVASASAAIARQIAKESPSLAGTAAALGMPERTLQRRLAENGVSHSRLVDDVRRDLALRYIGDAALGTSDIAYLLHFSDSTALHRAFRRWTGDTPAQYRRRLFEASPRR